MGDTVDLADHSGSVPDIGAPCYNPLVAIIARVNASKLNARTTIVPWSTSTQSTGQVEYGATPTYGQTSAVDVNRSSNHNVILSGLWPNTTYHMP